MKNLLLAIAVIAFIGVGCPSQSATSAPLSGEWSFKIVEARLSGSNCPVQGTAPFSSQGDANLSVSASGELASMYINGQQLVFHRQPGEVPQYKTGVRLFPVGGTEAGSVYFDFVAQTTQTIEGSINWDNNQGCVGDYPFAMGLIEPELGGEPETVVNTLSEGDWELNIDETNDNCAGESIAGFTGVPSSINLSPVINLDTGEPVTDEFYVEQLGITLQQIPNTNVYAQIGGTFDAGLPTDSQGDVLMDYENDVFDGMLEIQAGSFGEASGQLYINGDSCGAMMTFEMAMQ
jgi:hypothetical protein